MSLSDRRKFNRTTNRLCSPNIVLNGLRLVWIVTFIWGELGAFFWSLSGCRWPDSKLQGSGKPAHVLLLSDPQVQKPTTWRERSWSTSIRQFLYEYNLKKSWHVANRLNPHITIFLGDMLATGKLASSEQEYEQYFKKFKSIFQMKSSTPAYFLPGNNDIGMGTSFSRTARNQFSNTFGPFNQQIFIRNHTFALLDAPGLVDEDYQRAAHGKSYEKWTPIPEGPIEFVETIPFDDHPLILLTHIPLARPEAASCGPLRERGTIHRGVGHGYQNTLEKQTTMFLLDTLRPSAIFSGDDRDYCEYTHRAPADHAHESAVDPVREVTVKSFSLTPHIRRPGFQLLSLVFPPSTSSSTSAPPHTFADTPCLLPDQNRIYSSLYAPLFMMTLLGLLWFNLRRVRRRSMPVIVPISLSPRNGRINTQRSPLHPESAIWSPYTPYNPISPRGTLPPSLRTAKTSAGPTFRAASRPTTPYASPLLSPMAFPQPDHDHDEEEDDPMYPTQYASTREIQSQTRVDDHDHDEWTNGDDVGYHDESFHFLPSNGVSARSTDRTWSWSWTFVFRNRRRRMTVRLPKLPAWLVRFLGYSGDAQTKQRSVPKGTLMDFLYVIWPAAVVWVLIAWIMD